MLLLEALGLEKRYGPRLLFSVDALRVYSEDHIGLVGVNGAGKTTLLAILAGDLAPDVGIVHRFGTCAFLKQLAEGAAAEEGLSSRQAGTFKTSRTFHSHLSGGEKTRYRLAEILAQKPDILLADEPTAHLDVEGIEFLEEQLRRFPGAFLLVSHDREFLDTVCTKILEIDGTSLILYEGGYSEYRRQKEAKAARKAAEYEQYQQEKSRLEASIREKGEQSRTMRGTPKRMGNSEARLHKRSAGTKKAKLSRQARALESRLSQLQPKEKPYEADDIRLQWQEVRRPHSGVLLRAKDLAKAFGPQDVFSELTFQIHEGDKVALMGNNGTGKTTLLKMIVSRDSELKMPKSTSIGYFSQELDILDASLSVLANASEDSGCPEPLIRSVLGRLGFRGDAVFKKVSMLSGGERVKLCLAKLLLQTNNLLLLDEPSNFLDLETQEALEKLLIEYPGTVLFATHDRRLIRQVAQKLILLDGRQSRFFPGTAEELQKQQAQPSDDLHSQRMIIENRLADVTSRLSMPGPSDDLEALDREFQELVVRRRDLDRENS